eukprot:COSAG04_NODE_178_length_21394_cov_8.221507_15_plen_208_part_00
MAAMSWRLPGLLPLTTSPSSACTSASVIAPASIAERSSPIWEVCPTRSQTYFDVASTSTGISCLVGWSEPTATTVVPGRSHDASRTVAPPGVQVTMMSHAAQTSSALSQTWPQDCCWRSWKNATLGRIQQEPNKNPTRIQQESNKSGWPQPAMIVFYAESRPELRCHLLAKFLRELEGVGVAGHPGPHLGDGTGQALGHLRAGTCAR